MATACGAFNAGASAEMPAVRDAEEECETRNKGCTHDARRHPQTNAGDRARLGVAKRAAHSR